VGWSDLPEAVQASINRARNNATTWDYYAQYSRDGQLQGYVAEGRATDPIDLSTTYFTIRVSPNGRVLGTDQSSSGPLDI
jgi:hypothetical protein